MTHRSTATVPFRRDAGDNGKLCLTLTVKSARYLAIEPDRSGGPPIALPCRRPVEPRGRSPPIMKSLPTLRHAALPPPPSRHARQKPPAGAPKRSSWGRCPNGTCPISIPAMDARSSRRSRAGGAECAGLRRDLSRQARRAGARRGRRHALGRRPCALRGARGSARPHDVLCRPGLRRRHHRSEAGEVLRRHRRRSSPRPPATSCSSRSSSTGSTTRCSTRRCGDRRSALPAVARGPPQGQALPARGQARAAVPREVGHRARRLEPAVRRDHRRRCASTSRRGADARADAQPAAGRGREAPDAAEALAKVFKENLRSSR